jgi:hypothetical protein
MTKRFRQTHRNQSDDTLQRHLSRRRGVHAMTARDGSRPRGLGKRIVRLRQSFVKLGQREEVLPGLVRGCARRLSHARCVFSVVVDRFHTKPNDEEGQRFQRCGRRECPVPELACPFSCSEDMSLIDRADGWRARAADLRAIAETTKERPARLALESRAASLEEHATRLEYVTVKFCRLKRGVIPGKAKSAA